MCLEEAVGEAPAPQEKQWAPAMAKEMGLGMDS